MRSSLKRLRTDHIDLYQIHAWDPLTRPDEVGAALNTLKQQGKVRWFGVSNHNCEQMRCYSGAFEVSCLQPLYNLLDRKVEQEELPYCLSRRIGVITYSRWRAGAGRASTARTRTFVERAATARASRGSASAASWTHREREADGEEYGSRSRSLPRWVLTHPTTAILGVKKPDHITAYHGRRRSALPHPRLARALAGTITEPEQRGRTTQRRSPLRLTGWGDGLILGYVEE